MRAEVTVVGQHSGPQKLKVVFLHEETHTRGARERIIDTHARVYPNGGAHSGAAAARRHLRALGFEVA